MLYYVIAAVCCLVAIAIVTAFIGYQNHKKYPKSFKAKVTRIETVKDGDKVRYIYHLEGRDNGKRILTDPKQYKEKKYSVNERITVYAGKKGDACSINYPIWPTATSLLCLLLAVTVGFAYYADVNSDNSTDNTIGQENGYYIVTDSDVLMYGDNMGLFTISGGTEYVSTGDYGPVFYQGSPHYEDGAVLQCVHAFTANVTTDGTYEDLPEDAVKRVENLGYTINKDVTDFQTLVDAASEIEETEDDHDHEHEYEEELPVETGMTIEEQPLPDAVITGIDNSETQPVDIDTTDVVADVESDVVEDDTE